MNFKLLAAAAAVCGLSLSALAQIQINEFSNNSPGDDAPYEFVELINTSSAPIDLTGYALIFIEGDGGAGAGDVDVFIPLSGVVPANGGLALITQNLAATTWDVPATTVVLNRAAGVPAGAVWPAPTTGTYENGTATLLIVRNITGTIGDATDFDPAGDGTFVFPAGVSFEIVDSLSATDGGTTDRTYARAQDNKVYPQLGSAAIDAFADLIGFGRIAFELTGTAPYFGLNPAFTNPTGFTGTYNLTPGKPNTFVAPGTTVTATLTPDQPGCDLAGKTATVTVIETNEVKSATLGANGSLSITLDTPGPATLCVKVDGLLSKRFDNVNLAGSVDLGAATLAAGDTDNNGAIDDADLTNIILDFGGAGGSTSGFATDFDCNGVVDDADLTILILNFGAQGECL